MADYRYRVRAHHGMCLTYFRGAGYSSDFTKNMWTMKGLLEADPPVQLLAGTDDICAACPNNRDGICEDQEKVLEYDRQVLDRCGLTPGMVMPFREFQALVAEKILLPGKREEICGNCEWTGLCRF